MIRVPTIASLLLKDLSQTLKFASDFENSEKKMSELVETFTRPQNFDVFGTVRTFDRDSSL